MLSGQKLGSRIHGGWAGQGEEDLREERGKWLRPQWRNWEYMEGFQTFHWKKGSIWLYFCLRPLSSFEAKSTCHLLDAANVNTRRFCLWLLFCPGEMDSKPNNKGNGGKYVLGKLPGYNLTALKPSSWDSGKNLLRDILPKIFVWGEIQIDSRRAKVGNLRILGL